MAILIRPGTPHDAAPLASLLHEIGWFSAVQNETEAETTARLHAQLVHANPQNYTLLVAENEAEQLVGYTAVHWLPYLILSGSEGYVSELFLAEAARGQGMGTELLTAVIQQAKQRGCCRLQLLNMRNRESYQRGFYAKLGWQERENAVNFVLPLD
jgi:GNAT superfamily N-acetyltransferase